MVLQFCSFTTRISAKVKTYTVDIRTDVKFRIKFTPGLYSLSLFQNFLCRKRSEECIGTEELQLVFVITLLPL